jgi:hypothetical protein
MFTNDSIREGEPPMVPPSPIREGQPPILPPSPHGFESLHNYWLLFFGPAFGAVAGLFVGYLTYGAFRGGGGGGYYGEIRVFFVEYLFTGLLTGFLLGLIAGFWLGFKVFRRTKHRD